MRGVSNILSLVLTLMRTTTPSFLGYMAQNYMSQLELKRAIHKVDLINTLERREQFTGTQKGESPKVVSESVCWAESQTFSNP